MRSGSHPLRTRSIIVSGSGNSAPVCASAGASSGSGGFRPASGSGSGATAAARGVAVAAPTGDPRSWTPAQLQHWLRTSNDCLFQPHAHLFVGVNGTHMTGFTEQQLRDATADVLAGAALYNAWQALVAAKGEFPAPLCTPAAVPAVLTRVLACHATQLRCRCAPMRHAKHGRRGWTGTRRATRRGPLHSRGLLTPSSLLLQWTLLSCRRPCPCTFP